MIGVLAAVGFAATGPSGFSAQPEGSAAPTVLVTEVDTEITPVVADLIDDRIREATADGRAAYVVELDTPGGLASSMRDIVETILSSDVPVIVYVSPDGARAGSAGAIIALAAHVTVMAPGTTIGAATPVGLGGGDLSTKVVNDAAAQAESLAQLRGRDPDVAEAMVRDGRSLRVSEAIEENVADARAPSLDDALAAADGRDVSVADGRVVTMDTAGAGVERGDMGTFRELRQWLANPNLMFVFLLLAGIGLLFELASPGVGIAGGIGAVSLILALFSAAVLPVNVVGVLLLLLAVGLFVAELFAPGTGAFAVAGAVAAVLSGLFLFDDAAGAEVDLAVILPGAVLMAGLAVLAGRLVLRSARRPIRKSGLESLRGESVALQDIENTGGRAFLDGTWWNVRSTGAPLQEGAEATVVGNEGLTLIVESGGRQPASEREDGSGDKRKGA